MYKIVRKRELAPHICRMEVEAPRLASSALPGQFLIVRARPEGERIPLTICDYDRCRGTVSICTQVVGASTRMICALGEGECLTDVAGPLGMPSEFVHLDDAALKGRRYLFIAGGVGAAPVYPQVRYLHEKGARVDVIIGAKSASMLIFEEEMAAVCDTLHLCTDDGSRGFKGLVTRKAEELLAAGCRYDEAVAIGPMVMMKYVSLALKESGIPLTVSLNTIMVDGTGMCGACRVTVDGKTRFACVDGPEFDGYAVDYDEAMRRMNIYREAEQEADHRCRIGRDQ